MREMRPFSFGEAYGPLCVFAPRGLPSAPRDVAPGRGGRPADVASHLDAGSRPLSGVSIPHPAYPQPLYPDGCGPPVGARPRCVTARCPEVFLRQWTLYPPHFYGTPPPAACPLGTTDAAARATPGVDCPSADLGRGRAA